MKRARSRIRIPAAPARGGTSPQRDEASGTDRGGAPYTRLRLPHEHDEDVASMQGARRPVTERAARDLAEGRTDTDCYRQASLNFRRRHSGRRG
jgi:hypothetical protein